MKLNNTYPTVIGSPDADIHLLYESDFYRIMDFKCRCTHCGTSAPEFSDSFSISFVRNGNFLFNVFRHSLDSYTGCVLITKPGYERTVTHIQSVPDQCTILDFKPVFYEQLLAQFQGLGFLFDNDLHSTLVRINPETQYLHHQILSLVFGKGATRLELDNLVVALIQTVFAKVTDYHPDFDPNNNLKKNHLTTIERAKEYMAEHFADDISLMDIADHCHVSPFHFSRIFRTLTSWSPHQFLLHMRLKHAEMFLRSTALPVTEIAFSSGFNSLEHFTAAFTKKYGSPPSQFRISQPTVQNFIQA